MESNQLNNLPSEEALFELLTLTCEVDQHGNKAYYNKDGELHRIHGPAVIVKDGTAFWYKWLKNDMFHREDGPAIIWPHGREDYWINDTHLSKEQFIRWQEEHGIEPIK